MPTLPKLTRLQVFVVELSLEKGRRRPRWLAVGSGGVSDFTCGGPRNGVAGATDGAASSKVDGDLLFGASSGEMEAPGVLSSTTKEEERPARPMVAAGGSGRQQPRQRLLLLLPLLLRFDGCGWSELERRGQQCRGRRR